ncbi:MAG: DHH family phosphoesterase [Clostridia bacterium]|nr:DHH family phosphoesterase [Clostridia bacterium]
MQNSNRRIFDSLVSRTKIYLVLIFVLLVVICILKPIMIIPSIVLFVLIIAYTYFANNKRKSEISQHLQDLTLNVNSAAKNSLIHSPFPLIILETDGNIIWRSTRYVSEFANEDMSIYIGDLLDSINKKIELQKDEKDKNIRENIRIGNNDYKVLGEFIKSGTIDRKKQSSKYMMILYFIDETEENKLKREYENSKNCIGIVMIDNYEETMLQLDTEERPQIIAEIEKSIYEWANRIDGILIKADRDRFVYIFDYKYLEKIKEDKFSILDTIKDITINNKVQVTLSIAISNDGETNKEKYKTAGAAMDVILGRGGDQATIRENEKYQFFGGRTTEFEKRTKVKARIVAHALEELIKESEQIMIMGHKNPDIDAIGSALGICRLAKSLDKKANIVASTEGLALKELVQSLSEDEEYKDVIINKEVAENQITPDTLLVVVDTNKADYVEMPELLDKTGKIAIIDHHRRSTEFIKDSILTFHEVYASSAAELVTEVLQYTEVQPKLTTLEAEALYAGIMMDTKNFTFKTGVRTFEAAAYLRRYGIDIIKVKKWFQTDLETYKKIMNIVERTEIIKDIIGISIYVSEDKDAGIVCAKAADELLTIGNITTSFVLGTTETGISISGRSVGEINVQLILEKMGGGGHSTVAGAQVTGKSIDEVKQELIQRIDEYFEETES